MTREQIMAASETFERIVFELIAAKSQTAFNPAIIQAVRLEDPGVRLLADELYTSMRALVAGRAVWTSDTEAVPATWWDHVKFADVLPWWFLRWCSPPKMRRIQVRHYHVCPHTPTNHLTSGINAECLTFLTSAWEFIGDE